MDFDEDQKNQIGSKLTTRLVQALKNGEINQEQLAAASSYILDHINTITTHTQFIEFLTNLSTQWSIFSDFLAVEKSRITQKAEQQKTDQVRDLIENETMQKTGGTV